MLGKDVEKMVAVGLVWGATNTIMRKGALIWDQALKSTPQSDTSQLKKWLKLLLIWQYTLPYLINLSASATFFAILRDSPISLAVPVTIATTFAATAVFGMILGEETHVGLALLGTFSYCIGDICLGCVIGLWVINFWVLTRFLLSWFCTDICYVVESIRRIFDSEESFRCLCVLSLIRNPRKQ